MEIIKSHQTLTYITQFLPKNPIIVEAGAFCGADTQKMSALWPQGAIYAFEPVPENFKRLEQATAHLPNVVHYPLALSTQVGTAILHVSHNPAKPQAPSPTSSLLKAHERLQWSPIQYDRTIQVNTTTLDAWAQKFYIPQVDLLWLDLQGHELAVMQASPNIIAQARVIVCEVQFVKAYENCPLSDEVQQWVESQGFVTVAKDFTNTTDWFFGNFVFVRN